MKYTIEGLYQEKMLELGLDCIDAVIIRYIVDFYCSTKMTKVYNEGKEYFWLSYNALLKQVPIIGITTKNALAKRMKKYVECGLMENYTKREEGSYSCYRFTSLYDELIYDENDKKIK
jgi:hypothetical protein